MSRIRVQFIHGLEGNPQGRKARLFAEHFDARTPAMDTKDYGACVAVQAETLREFAPAVLVGSSFGGAVAVTLLQRGLWCGPTLLLAQAALHYDPEASLPQGVRVWLVHGLRDTLVDPDESRNLAATGSPALVRLLEVDDDHPLSRTTGSGRLLDIVRELVAVQGEGPARA